MICETISASEHEKEDEDEHATPWRKWARAENLELITVTQLSHRANASVTGLATEIVCFLLDEPLAPSRRLELDGDPEAGCGVRTSSVGSGPERETTGCLS